MTLELITDVSVVQVKVVVTEVLNGQAESNIQASQWYWSLDRGLPHQKAERTIQTNDFELLRLRDRSLLQPHDSCQPFTCTSHRGTPLRMKHPK